jgi:hypothetical protein
LFTTAKEEGLEQGQDVFNHGIAKSGTKFRREKIQLYQEKRRDFSGISERKKCRLVLEE